MKVLSSEKSPRALTLIDVLIAIATVALVVTFLMIAPTRRTRVSGPRIACVNNLRQVGLAFRMWSNDHSEHFPWNIAQPARAGESSATTELLQYFEIASNDLCSSKILVCPADPGRTRAIYLAPLSNMNISYFIGLDSNVTNSNAIVSGDRNLSTNNVILSGVVNFRTAAKVRWTSAIHNNVGNVGLGDGSVQQVSSSGARQCITNAGLPLRLSIP